MDRLYITIRLKWLSRTGLVLARNFEWLSLLGPEMHSDIIEKFLWSVISRYDACLRLLWKPVTRLSNIFQPLYNNSSTFLAFGIVCLFCSIKSMYEKRETASSSFFFVRLRKNVVGTTGDEANSPRLGGQYHGQRRLLASSISPTLLRRAGWYNLTVGSTSV